MKMHEKGETNALKIDQQILDKFWTLSEAGASSTIKATNQLVELLYLKQKQNNEGSTEELEYCLKRLVKGLASSRESARQGFSVALCQVLRKFNTISVEELLSLVSKHIKLPKKESKAEAGYSYLGESLAYLTLIQSGRLLKDNGFYVRKVTKSLLSIGHKRSYLQQICYSAVCLITKQAGSEEFKQYVWPEVESRLQCGWEQCSPDLLCLLITCRKFQSDLVNKQFLKEYWNTKKLFKEDNFPKLWKVLLGATTCYPVIHTVNKLVVQELVENKCSLGQFWQTGQDHVFGTSNMRILNIGFHMLLELLPLADSPDEMKLLLTPQTVKIWVKNIDGNLRDVNPLLTVTKSVGSELIRILKTCSNPELQVTIMKRVISTDIKPKNETLKTLDLLIQQLSSDAAKDYGKYLMESIINQSSDDTKHEGMLSPLDMVMHLRILVTLPSTATDHDWQLELLQFLVLHAYWNVTGKSETLKHCDTRCDNMTEKLRKQFQDNFHKAITQLLIFKTESSKSTSVHAYKETIYQLVIYMQQLLVDGTTVVLVKPMTNQVKEDWNTILKNVEEIHSQEDAGGSSLNHAFGLLFLYNAIQLFTEGEKDSSTLEDFIVCYKKATEKKPKSASKKTKEEPAWIEVLTELLLSMMSHGSTYSRVVAKNVFACLTNHITPDAMSLITEVLRVEKPGEDDAVLDIEDDQADDSEEMESDDNEDAKDQDVDMQNEESDSDADSDSSESDGEVNDELRTALKSALGPAAVEEDESEEAEEEDEDLSDSEMFKLDEALSQVFKNMKRNKDKEKKETEKQLNVFKLRVLDMVEALVKIQPPADLVLDLLFPLLELMEHGQKQKENRELSNRATHVFKLMYKKSKVHSDTIVGTDKYLESLKAVIEFSKKVLDKSLLMYVSDACFLVIRLLLNLELSDIGPSPVKTRSHKGQDNKASKIEQEQERIHNEMISVLDSAMQTCLGKRESKLSPTFFINILTKSPVVCWPLTKTLLQIVKDSKSKVYFKTQACAMLAVMINKLTHENVEQKEWQQFSKELLQTIENILGDCSEDKVNNKLLTEVFQVLSKLIPFSDNVQLPEETIEKLSSLKQKFSTDSRRMFNTVMGKLRAQKSNQSSKQKRKIETDSNQKTVEKKKKKK